MRLREKCVRDGFAIYDNNISPRLVGLMIIIKIILLSYISYKSDTLMISSQRVGPYPASNNHTRIIYKIINVNQETP